MPVPEVRKGMTSVRFGTQHAAEDAGLVRKAIDGDEAAFSTLYERYARMIHGLLLARVPREDARLGRRRPEQVEALRASLQARLDDARRLRLLKDRWTIRQALYRDWQRSAGVQLLQLVRLEPVLLAIQSFEGPEPDVLMDSRRRLATKRSSNTSTTRRRNAAQLSRSVRS